MSEKSEGRRRCSDSARSLPLAAQLAAARPQEVRLNEGVRPEEGRDARGLARRRALAALAASAGRGRLRKRAASRDCGLRECCRAALGTPSYRPSIASELSSIATELSSIATELSNIATELSNIARNLATVRQATGEHRQKSSNRSSNDWRTSPQI